MDPKNVPFKFNNLIKPIPSDLYRMDRVGKAMRRNQLISSSINARADLLDQRDEDIEFQDNLLSLDHN